MQTWKPEFYRRVTRLVVLLGLIMAIAFGVLSVVSGVYSLQDNSAVVSEKKQTTGLKDEAITKNVKGDRMLEQSLVNIVIGLCTGIVGSFVGFACWPWLRQRKIWKRMRAHPECYPGFGGFWCRIVNDSRFNMGKAIAYITIVHEVDDILPPPPGRNAYNERLAGLVPREVQLCWAVQELASNLNPMRVEIYPGEKQPLAFGSVEDNLIEIFSEKCREPARVFLVRKIYKGTLKVVCMDCQAKEFPFEIDPDASVPIKFST